MRTACAVLLLASTLLSGCGRPSRSVPLGATTTLRDSGFLDVFVPVVADASGLAIDPVVGSSRHVHDLLRRGEIEVAITHDPIGERALVDAGVIEEPRPLMESRFLIVGPAHDPARVRHADDPIEAFRAIARAGAPFRSREDGSGTARSEQRLWKESGIDPARLEARVVTGQSMSALLRTADEAGAYALTDSATWERARRSLRLRELCCASDHPLTRNRYVILLRRGHAPPAARVAEAMRVDSAIEILRAFRVGNVRPFRPVDSGFGSGELWCCTRSSPVRATLE